MKCHCFPPVWRVAILSVLMLGGSLGRAQTFPRSLETVEVVHLNGQETLRFGFSQPFQGLPVEEHGKGGFSLRFSGTGSQVPRYEKAVRDGKLLKSFLVVQSRYATTASFTLIDPKASLAGRLRFDNQGTLLGVTIENPPAGAAGPTAPPPGRKDLLGEMTERIAGGGTAPLAQSPAAGDAAKGEPAPLGNFAGVEWLPTMVTLAVSLAAMLLALYGVLFAYNRFFARRWGQPGKSQAIRQVASFHIGPKQRVVILDINGEYIACGVTPTQISFLTKLEGGRAAQRRAAGKTPAGPAGAPRAESTAPLSGGTPRPAGPSDPVQQFADALKEKVGSLKRLK